MPRRIISQTHRGQPVLTTGPQLNLWRAPIDNERARPDCLAPRLWQPAMLDRLQHRVDSVRIEHHAEDATLHIRTRVAPPCRSFELEASYVYRVHGDGRVRLVVSGQFCEGWPHVLPRIGLHLCVPITFEHVKWYGLGPGESYRDSHCAQRMGVYCTTVQEMVTPYPCPQEYGNRSEVHWFELTSAQGCGTRIEHDSPLNFSAHPFTLNTLSTARHPHELLAADALQVYIDCQHNGLGSHSCEVALSESYHCKPEPFQFALAWHAL